jgi:hypothetical protein
MVLASIDMDDAQKQSFGSRSNMYGNNNLPNLIKCDEPMLANYVCM